MEELCVKTMVITKLFHWNFNPNSGLYSLHNITVNYKTENVLFQSLLDTNQPITPGTYNRISLAFVNFLIKANVDVTATINGGHMEMLLYFIQTRKWIHGK